MLPLSFYIRTNTYPQHYTHIQIVNLFEGNKHGPSLDFLVGADWIKGTCMRLVIRCTFKHGRTVVVNEAGLDDFTLGTLGVDLADKTLLAVDRRDTQNLSISKSKYTQ